MIRVSIFLVLVSQLITAHADEKFYTSVSYSVAERSINFVPLSEPELSPELSYETDIDQLSISLGYQIKNWLAVEGTYTRGITSETSNRGVISAQLDDGAILSCSVCTIEDTLENKFAVSAVIGYSINNWVYPYVRVGYSYALYDVDVEPTELASIYESALQSDESGLLYGAGLRLKVSDIWQITTEYFEEESVDGVNFGVRLVF